MDNLITLAEAANRLALSYPTANHWARIGLIPYVRVGNYRMVTLEAVKACQERQAAKRQRAS